MDFGYKKKLGFCVWGFSIFNNQERGFSTFNHQESCVEKKSDWKR